MRKLIIDKAELALFGLLNKIFGIKSGVVATKEVNLFRD